MNTLNVVEAVFFAALEKNTPEDRAAYLDEACRADANLRCCVERLLNAHPKAEGFLQSPAPGVSATRDEPPPIIEKAGSIIGPYKLLQQLGEGGFGVVFLAEQEHPVRRQVALKIIKPGMDSQQVIARFEAERQALALMDHPNIAKVHDAGTTENGRPYFVMELVKGVPITDFCDQNRLTPRERLELFVPVCQAVQHAHQKGIIHRDLKPSNVLVTLYDGQPVPKVIDFGVAKAIEQRLTEQTLFTKIGQVIGTLEYMSPEQASLNALDVDTRSDVYSLGVLLYELLTGATPLDKERFQGVAFMEMLRLIREEEPPKPSNRLSAWGGGLPMIAAYRKTESQKLPALVRGDLDWIVMKGLDKDRTQRYETASALAADIRRYLAEEPVEARPPSAVYRLRKFVKRHRGPVVAAAVVLLALVAGVIGTTGGLVEAVAARNRAVTAEGEAKTNEQKAREEEQQAQRERDDAKAAREELRRSLYFAAMNLIPAAWEADNVGRVVELLQQQIPGPNEEDLRGFEWHYWDRLCHADRRTLQLDEVVQNVTLSGDGSRVATQFTVHDGEGKANTVIKVRDLKTGKELHSWTIENPAKTESGSNRVQVLTMAFSRDGARLAFSRDGARLLAAGLVSRGENRVIDNRVIVWDVATGKELFRKESIGRTAAISADGTRVAALQVPVQLVVWDISDPNQTPTVMEARIKFGLGQRDLPDLRFSPNGTRLAAIMVPTSDTKVSPEIQLWDTATGKVVAKIARKIDGDLSDRFTALAFNPDGSRLAAVATKMGKPGATFGLDGPSHTYLWDGAAADELKLLRTAPVTQSRLTATARALEFTPDGGRLAVWKPGDQVVRLLDTVTGAEQQVLKGYEASVHSVAFRPDGMGVFTAGNRIRVGEGNAVVKEWDLTAREPGAVFAAPRPPFTDRWVTSWSADGNRSAVCISKRSDVIIYDRTGKELLVFREHTGEVSGAHFSPDARLVVSWGIEGELKVWETDTGKVRYSRAPDGKRLGREFPKFSADGRFLAFRVTEGMKIVRIDDDDAKELFSVGDATIVYFRPDDRRLLAVRPSNPSSKQEGEAKLWDVEAGRVVSSYPSFGTNGATFSPDGRSFVALPELLPIRVRQVAPPVVPDLIVWDAARGAERIVLKGAGGSWCVFHPDATRLLVLSAPKPNGAIRATGWDLTTGKVIYRLQGLSGEVTHVVFSPDGKRIALGTMGVEGKGSRGGPGEIKLWDAATGRELLSLKALMTPRGNGLSFSPDGHRLFLRSQERPGGVRHEMLWDATPRAAERPQP